MSTGLSQKTLPLLSLSPCAHTGASLGAGRGSVNLEKQLNSRYFQIKNGGVFLKESPQGTAVLGGSSCSGGLKELPLLLSFVERVVSSATTPQSL